MDELSELYIDKHGNLMRTSCDIVYGVHYFSDKCHFLLTCPIWNYYNY